MPAFSSRLAICLPVRQPSNSSITPSAPDRRCVLPPAWCSSCRGSCRQPFAVFQPGFSAGQVGGVLDDDFSCEQQLANKTGRIINDPARLSRLLPMSELIYLSLSSPPCNSRRRACCSRPKLGRGDCANILSRRDCHRQGFVQLHRRAEGAICAQPADQQGALRQQDQPGAQCAGAAYRHFTGAGGKLKAKAEIRIASLFKQAPAAFLKMIVVQ